MMEAVGTSETSINFYETTRRNIPEDSSSDAVCFHKLYAAGVGVSSRKVAKGKQAQKIRKAQA
jgi:hypothetical protein